MSYYCTLNLKDGKTERTMSDRERVRATGRRRERSFWCHYVVRCFLSGLIIELSVPLCARKSTANMTLSYSLWLSLSVSQGNSKGL